MITLTIPNDDHIALRAFGKALEEMALAHGAEPRNTTVGEMSYELHIDTSEATAALERLRTTAEELQPEVDTTAQQVESLASTESVAEKLNRLFIDDGDINPTIDSTDTPWDERIHSTSKALNADGTWRLRRKPKDMDEAEWAAFVESVKTELTGAMESFDEQVNMEEDSHRRAIYAPENYVHMYRATDNIYGLAKSDVELADFEADGYVRHTQEQYDAWEGPTVADEGDDFHTDAGVVTEQTVAGIPPLPVPPPVVVAPTHTSDVGVLLMRAEADAQPTWDFPRLMTFLTERHGKIDVATVNTLLAQDGMLSVQELNAHPDKIGPFVARVKAHLGE